MVGSGTHPPTQPSRETTRKNSLAAYGICSHQAEDFLRERGLAHRCCGRGCGPGRGPSAPATGRCAPPPAAGGVAGHPLHTSPAATPALQLAGSVCALATMGVGVAAPPPILTGHRGNVFGISSVNHNLRALWRAVSTCCGCHGWGAHTFRNPLQKLHSRRASKIKQKGWREYHHTSRRPPSGGSWTTPEFSRLSG